MSRTIIEEGHPTIAVGEHGRRPFRLVASYDGLDDSYLVHVYIGPENEADATQHVDLLKRYPTQDDALDAGEQAAMKHIGGV